MNPLKSTQTNKDSPFNSINKPNLIQTNKDFPFNSMNPLNSTLIIKDPLDKLVSRVLIRNNNSDFLD